MVCGLACQLEASKTAHGRVALICCWSPESSESRGTMSTAASLPDAHPALPGPFTGRELTTGMRRWGCFKEHWGHRRETGSLLSSVPYCGLLALQTLGMVPCSWRAGNTVCKQWVTLPKASLLLLGGSLLTALRSSCSQAHSNHLGGSSWNISGSCLLPYCGSNSQQQHLPPLSLPPPLCKHLQWIINCGSSN